jgi:predicted DNA-binding transcriptional regulator YafY
MRASRLVNLLLLLQARGHQTSAQLASELEVSVRTVYRDVEALAQAGVPIYAERGPAGGVRLVDGYRTRLTGLTSEEAEALFLSGLPGPAAQLGLGTVVAAARLKVMAALPPELRTRAARIQARFHLDAPGWFQQAEPMPSLELLASAVWEGREVELTYRREEHVERRRLAPLGLVLKGGTWYLVARSKGEPRTFRVSRIEDAVLGDVFERPADFDLAAFWAASTARFEEAQAPVEVVARVQPGCREALERTIGPTAAATLRRVGRASEDGGETVRFRHESMDIAYLDLLRLGGRVEAMGPQELRERLVTAARGLAERYGVASRAG